MTVIAGGSSSYCGKGEGGIQGQCNYNVTTVCLDGLSVFMAANEVRKNMMLY